MNAIICEAARISKELESATFVGSVAVMLHTSVNRATKGIDVVVDGPISDRKYKDLGYVADPYNRKRYTPRKYKIDVFSGRDLNGIPIRRILDTATPFVLDKGRVTLKAISLEGLVVSKFRAGRDRDVEDLHGVIAANRGMIDRERLAAMCRNAAELAEVIALVKRPGLGRPQGGAERIKRGRAWEAWRAHGGRWRSNADPTAGRSRRP